MKKHKLALFFVLSFVITWGLAGLYFLMPELLTNFFGPISTSNPLFIIAVWAPSISAFLVTAVTEGKPGVIGLLKRFLPSRVNLRWYMLALFAVPVCSIFVNLVSGSSIGLFSMESRALLSLLFVNLVTGPLGEEFGWRGLALPRLLQRSSPVVASLIVGIVWGLWQSRFCTGFCCRQRSQLSYWCSLDGTWADRERLTKQRASLDSYCWVLGSGKETMSTALEDSSGTSS